MHLHICVGNNLKMKMGVPKSFGAKPFVLIIIGTGCPLWLSKQDIVLQRLHSGEPRNFPTLVRGWHIVFEVEDRESIGGSAYGGQRAVCCTADLAKLGVCSEGEIIHRPSTKNPGWPQVFGVAFYADEQVATLPSKSIQISRTGMYNLYFMHCDPNLKEVVVEGINTIWKNTSRMAPLMKFYGFMSPAFVMLGLLWFSQYARFWKEVLPWQNCITLVITLGMFEMAFWYSDYAEFNETGIRPTGILGCSHSYLDISVTFCHFK
jgi:hypothetical protein